MIRPIRDQIVIKRTKAREISDGRMVIDQTMFRKSEEGEVIAVGGGRVDLNGNIVKLEVKVGDRVIVSKNSYSEINVEGEDYLVVSEDGILVVIQ